MPEDRYNPQNRGPQNGGAPRPGNTAPRSPRPGQNGGAPRPGASAPRDPRPGTAAPRNPGPRAPRPPQRPAGPMPYQPRQAAPGHRRPQQPPAYYSSRHPIGSLNSRRRRRPTPFVIIVALFILILIIVIATSQSCRNLFKKGPDPADSDKGASTSAPAETTDGVTSAPAVEETTDEIAVTPPENEFIIYIDPGHGFIDSGAESDYLGEYTECDITLMVAKEIVSMLNERGYTARLTHDGTVIPDSPEHDEMANRFHINERSSFVNANGVDLFVSLHCDSFSDESVSGTRLYYCSDYEYADEAVDLMNMLTRAIGEMLPNGKKITHFGDPASNAYHVTSKVNAPSVLVEMGFISNPEDAANALDPEWRTKMATGIANGIAGYIAEHETDD